MQELNQPIQYTPTPTPTPTSSTTDPFYKTYNSPTDGNLKLPQVAQLFQVSPETIKRYEREGLIKPLRHGFKQTRYYTPEHIELLKHIIKTKKEQYKKNALHMVKIRQKRRAKNPPKPVINFNV